MIVLRTPNFQEVIISCETKTLCCLYCLPLNVLPCATVSAGTCKLISLNVRGIGNFKKRKMMLLGVENRTQILFSYKKLTPQKTRKRVGKMNGEARWLWLMAAPIHVGWLFLLKRVLIVQSTPKSLTPWDEKMYVLINVYAPNKDTNITKFLNSLLTTLRKNNLDEEENIIIGGDFNCPPNPTLDKKGGLLIPRKSVVTTIENIQEELDLVDIWRVKNPERKSFTWSQNSPMIFVVWITGWFQIPYTI